MRLKAARTDAQVTPRSSKREGIPLPRRTLLALARLGRGYPRDDAGRQANVTPDTGRFFDSRLSDMRRAAISRAGASQRGRALLLNCEKKRCSCGRYRSRAAYSADSTNRILLPSFISLLFLSVCSTVARGASRRLCGVSSRMRDSWTPGVPRRDVHYVGILVRSTRTTERRLSFSRSIHSSR